MSTDINIIDTKLLSFTQLFGQAFKQVTVSSIEIPLIQRDYAQGRKGAERIRSQFINSICSVLQPNSVSIELDFVYGDVNADGEFMPLDGQQRLTLLFLLHCYLAWHQPAPSNPPTWTKFSYATRPSAREFCKLLSQCRPQFDVDSPTSKPSCWLIDQAEYLPTWDHDPSIQSMLVVLDDLHKWFVEHPINLDAAWDRLTSLDNPAIQFHLLPMASDGSANLQYIKMNSRGKPLTPFENFKAQFEEKLVGINVEKAKEFAQKIDGNWSDLLWEYRGEDNLVDDEFMRYFRFVNEISAWKNNIDLRSLKKANDLIYLSKLVESIYSLEQSKSQESLDFLFHAFDIWYGKSVKDEFEMLFTNTPAMPDRLLIFNSFRKEGVDLFHACCRYYGTQEWDLPRTLLFYGVLLCWGQGRENSKIASHSRYLRILRNLIEASRGNEIREEFMPRLLSDVQHIMSGNLGDVSTFNQEQKQNELDKLELLQIEPSVQGILYQLEDHELLRGGLTAFDFDPSAFLIRAQVFLKTFDKNIPRIDITAALLSHGDYAKTQNRGSGYRFAHLGSPQNNEPWQKLFRGKGQGATIHPVRKPLMALLDALGSGSTLQDESQCYVNNPNTAKDWRYYLVKYKSMREGDSGRYVFNTNGYEACMLRKEQMNSYHADPYLCAVVEVSGVGDEAIANTNWPNAFYGYETNARWLNLKQSGIRLRSVELGWEISDVPVIQQAALQKNLQNIQGATIISVENESYIRFLVEVAKSDKIDAVDRIEVGADLLRMLAGSGY